tara:strand:- start:67435 stop:68169 length:735 start_codon:yes stop_codon:yes gene_type:complete
MQKAIDINADLGEGYCHDDSIMPLISSCNIACGGHYGDENSIIKALHLAKKYKVKVGAHPSYPDREGFGRKTLNISGQELIDSLLSQLRLMDSLCEKNDVVLNHVKLHGALYNVATIDEEVSRAVLEALLIFDKKIEIYVPYHSVLHHLVKGTFPVKFEAFIDRRYNDDGNLVHRSHQNALIRDPKTAWKQLFQIYKNSSVTSVQGKEIVVHAGTFCIHGDQENAVEILEYIHTELKRNKIRLC